MAAGWKRKAEDNATQTLLFLPLIIWACYHQKKKKKAVLCNTFLREKQLLCTSFYRGRSVWYITLLALGKVAQNALPKKYQLVWYSTTIFHGSSPPGRHPTRLTALTEWKYRAEGGRCPPGRTSSIRWTGGIALVCRALPERTRG